MQERPQEKISDDDDIRPSRDDVFDDDHHRPETDHVGEDQHNSDASDYDDDDNDSSGDYTDDENAARHDDADNDGDSEIAPSDAHANGDTGTEDDATVAPDVRTDVEDDHDGDSATATTSNDSTSKKNEKRRTLIRKHASRLGKEFTPSAVNYIIFSLPMRREHAYHKTQQIACCSMELFSVDHQKQDGKLNTMFFRR